MHLHSSTTLALTLLILLSSTTALTPASAATSRRLAYLSALFRFNPPVAAGDECGGDDWGVAGQFDLYVLAQSWSAEYCYPSAHRDYPGCLQPTDWQRANLTLHGLWPQYAQQTGGHPWPQCCNTAYGSELNASVVAAELPRLQRYWPNEQSPSGIPLSDSLWSHEWAKHGACANASQPAYLARAIALMQQLPTPAIIRANVGGSAARADIEAAYNGGSACGSDSCMVWLQCAGGGYLSEVHTCWSREGKQVVCPKLVVSESGRCTGSQVKISKFTSTRRW